MWRKTIVPVGKANIQQKAAFVSPPTIEGYCHWGLQMFPPQMCSEDSNFPQSVHKHFRLTNQVSTAKCDLSKAPFHLWALPTFSKVGASLIYFLQEFRQFAPFLCTLLIFIIFHKYYIEKFEGLTFLYCIELHFLVNEDIQNYVSVW